MEEVETRINEAQEAYEVGSAKIDETHDESIRAIELARETDKTNLANRLVKGVLGS